ncbi:39S ribosomal protein L50, mitochondrial-like [Teleopsis dalmanni]|uniref:39S ribosomal protein L50, mitochondrial-like n=1 Tax=Teleopsis dalmanni TaxID=139649 RepID=UPI0018CFCABC|nr:39S ribosomal protein L50, mitochondrial-like [Teleopsis dalmanni]XP_037933574.1 39S ribosomal protein L50, mitochondrial-like [Teleopsis dalmanni]
MYKNNVISLIARSYSKKHLKRPKIINKAVEDVGKSLSNKGFLRSHKPYDAPADAVEKVHSICSTLQIPNKNEYKLNNLEEKFKFLEACFASFNHGVPNSQVHEVQTIGDVVDFYQRSVNTTVPYEAFKNMELPENLHIQYEYLRFHPDTDTKFGGKSAFPKSSTLVTGIKYREKYAGHIAKRSWP